MRPTTRWRPYAVIAAAVVAVTACGAGSGGSATDGGDGAAGGSQAPVEIGVILSTSGKGAVFGVDQRNGVDVAVAMVNAAGGIDGHPIKTRFEDSAYEKTQAQSIMSKMAPDESVIGVIGPTSSAEAFAADPIANSAQLPVLAISNGAEGIPQIGEYVHRVGVPEEQLLPGVAHSVVEERGVKSAAILYASNDPFALTGYKAFSATLKSDGVTITDVVPYNSDKTVNFTPQLQGIARHDPDALFIAAKSDEGAVILRQADQLNLDVVKVGNLAFTSPALLQAAGAAADGLVVGATWSPSDDSKLNSEFKAEYQKKFDKAPSPLSATAFNAVYIIKQALESAKSYDRAGLQDGMESMSGYDVVGAPVKFIDVGNGLRDASTPTPILLEANGGTFTAVD